MNPVWGNSIPDLILTDKEELITELKISGSLYTSDCELITFICKQNKAKLVSYTRGSLKRQFYKAENNYGLNQLGKRI